MNAERATLRADRVPVWRTSPAAVVRARAYSFVLDARGMPIELGSGRSAKAYLGEERWLESKTGFRREVAIKVLQRGVSQLDYLRFQMEKDLLERVQGHPNIVAIHASGEADVADFVPAPIRGQVEGEFLVLERLDLSLEEHLKGSGKAAREDLLARDPRERLFTVLDYVIPVASAVEFAHLERNVCHRDIKPANVLIKRRHPLLRGSTLEVRLADFNVAKVHSGDVDITLTRGSGPGVPGTLFFQSPEQEMNLLELLVNVERGSSEVDYFEDFYIPITPGDTFAIYNREDEYKVVFVDRGRKKIFLAVPYREAGEVSVRAKVQKSVGRPADIYSIGALLYYLVSGAYANPKTLYDDFHKFIEYDAADESNTIDSYLSHQYALIDSLRAPAAGRRVDVSPGDRFFSYKPFLDGNGELIDPNVMRIIARCMIRNKPDSYCASHDLETTGIREVVRDLVDLYAAFGGRFGARAFGKPSGPLARRAERGALGALRRWLARRLARRV